MGGRGKPREAVSANATSDAVPPAGAADAVPAPAAAAEERIAVATQWQLVWWKFRKHKLAMLGGAVVLILYVTAIFAEFLAPFEPNRHASTYLYAPPQSIRWIVRNDDGWRIQPHVLGLTSRMDPSTFRRTYEVNPDAVIPIGLLVRTEPYRMWGFLTLDRRLLGPIDGRGPMYLLGADRLGRDVFSRVIHGTRISMSIGLVGVILSLLLGVVLGGISGYFGGITDNLIQRTIEFIRSIPAIPLWMGLAAAIPLTWSPLTVYFMITVILSLIGWTGLARMVRGKFLSLKVEDFVTAARLDGASEMRVIMRHMVPSFTSHIIATVTLAIPRMILSETALSFLGIGLRPPVVSWGVLLQEAQNVRALATAPWLLWPGVAVVVAVLALNFLGDGLRDAADPYHT